MRAPNVLAIVAGLALCQACADPDAGDCSDDTCDLPDLAPERACKLRRADALESAQRAYTAEAIRWSCADVEGVNTNKADNRGQEYCEYYALVRPPGDGAKTEVLGKLAGSGTTSLSIALTDAQIDALEASPTAVVGQCVFHSWHSDIAMPACQEGSCPQVLGYRLDAKETFEVNGKSVTVPMFRMTLGANSNNAAKALAKDCMKASMSGATDDFTRGCEMCGNLLESTGACLPWRKSDATICAGAMRLAECGCGLKAGGDLAAGLVPRSSRGFPLGTWSGIDELPAGCNFVDPGDGSQTVVSCDLTAADLMASARDPKGLCRSRYGDNVVVHVPVPADAVACTPPDGADCSATPWVIEP
jgi:hypothetical protein